MPSYEDVPRDVITTDREYPAGFVFPAHTHCRSQFAYAATGVITVLTAEGNCIVPPQCAIWVPAGIPHEMHMSGPVRMLNAFIHTRAEPANTLLAHCRVLGTSSLLRDLLFEAVRLPSLYGSTTRAGKIMSLLIDEIATMRPLSLNAPMPDDPRLASLCRELFESPSIAHDIDSMADRIGMSRRSFTRFFREQTGVSFTAWRQQMCLLTAVARLSRGDSITRIATDLGYSSPGAFSVLFKRLMGDSPLQYLKEEGDGRR
jgi:AraC-like DNA-binding protein